MTDENVKALRAWVREQTRATTGLIHQIGLESVQDVTRAHLEFERTFYDSDVQKAANADIAEAKGDEKGWGW